MAISCGRKQLQLMQSTLQSIASEFRCQFRLDHQPLFGKGACAPLPLGEGRRPCTRERRIEPNVSSTDEIAGLIWSTVYRSLEYDNGTRVMPKDRWFNLTRCSSKTGQSKCLYCMYGQCHKILSISCMFFCFCLLL